MTRENSQDGSGIDEISTSFAAKSILDRFGTTDEPASVHLRHDKDYQLSSLVNLLLLHVSPFNHFPGSFSEPVGVEQLAGTIKENLIDKYAPISISLSVVESRLDVEFILERINSGYFTHLGLGMPLGSYETALTIIERTKLMNESRDAYSSKPIRVFVGGNLPTNLPEKYLVELVEKFPFVAVIRGWGDKPLLSLLQKELNLSNEPVESISGLVYHDGKKVNVNPLSIDYTKGFIAGKPLRLLLKPEMVGNIVASENCSHPHCTFCARMPFFGSRERWAPKPTDQIIEQMADFSALGILQGTFTDEEALGTTPDHAISHAGPLAQAIIQAKIIRKIDPRFLFAFSTRSDSIVGLAEKKRLDILEDLKKAGLFKVFVGMETGVPHDFKRWDGLIIPSQGKRYGKGMKVNTHIDAANILEKLDIGIEIGFIPFDPLVDLGEIRENAEFLLRYGLARHTSAIFNKLRVQAGTKYSLLMNNILKRLLNEGQLAEIPQLLGKFNLSTLQTEYNFLHSIVEEIVGLIMEMEKENGQSLYVLKSYHRSKFITGDPIEGRGFETLTNLRDNDLRLLVAITDWIEDELKWRGIPREEYDHLACSFHENEKLEVIKKFYREERNRIWDVFLQTDMPEYLRKGLLANSA
jgi:radical SAM superfamily enzyme YgiQ (UPF0313 family)